MLENKLINASQSFKQLRKHQLRCKVNLDKGISPLCKSQSLARSSRWDGVGSASWSHLGTQVLPAPDSGKEAEEHSRNAFLGQAWTESTCPLPTGHEFTWLYLAEQATAPHQQIEGKMDGEQSA